VWRTLAILVFVTMPVMAETFKDRWPEPDAVETTQEEATVWPKLERKRETKVRKQKVFVCHKRYYFKRGYRYWRCKR
jgi:hypothetical protein